MNNSETTIINKKIMSHVEGEDRSEQPNKVQTAKLIRAIFFLALKTQGRRRMDNTYIPQQRYDQSKKKKRKRKRTAYVRRTL